MEIRVFVERGATGEPIEGIVYYKKFNVGDVAMGKPWGTVKIQIRTIYGWEDIPVEFSE